MKTISRFQLRIRPSTLRGLFVLLLFCFFSTVQCTEETKASIPQQWLVLGGFPDRGDNSLYKDFFKPSSSEQRVRPRSGDSMHTMSGATLRWRDISVQQNVFLNVGTVVPAEKKGIAYAYTVLLSEKEETIAATFGHSGSLRVWLNGELVHENRISRKPEPDKDVLVLSLKKGKNAVLVKIGGTQPYWGFYFKEHRPSTKLFVNDRLIILPDVRAGEFLRAWGQVEVANVSADSLFGMTVEVIGDRLMVPSRTSSLTLGPGDVRRVPFWLQTKTAVSESVAAPFQLRISGREEECLVQCTPRIRRRNEYFVTTYRSGLDGSVQPYSLLLPTTLNPDSAYPLVVLLHGAWVTDWGQNIISYDSKEWIIQVAVHDRGNNRYRDIGQVDLDEVLHEVKRNYRIDGDRIFLAGHSMGGYGTWFQATKHPDRWAAISPQAGYTDYFLYHPAMSDAQDNSVFKRKLLEDWSPLLFAENLKYVPAYIIHGAKDDNVAVEHSRKMAARLKDLNYTFIYDENPGQGHWWGPRGAKYGIEVVDKPPIWSFFQEHHHRQKNPRMVLYKTTSLRYNTVYWVTIDELDTVYAPAQIRAEISGENKIEIVSNNITQFTLHLNDSLINTRLPVELTVNGRVAFEGCAPRSLGVTLRKTMDGGYTMLMKNDDLSIPSLDRTDGWSVAGELDKHGGVSKLAEWNDDLLKKTPSLFGPVVDAFNSKFLFIVGTSNRKRAMSEAIQKSADRMARTWESFANGIVRIKKDSQITIEDIVGNNLVLFGNETSNTVLAQIKGRLPIRFSGNKVVVGKDEYAGDDVGAVMIYPNPLSQSKYVVVIAGTTPASYDLASRIPVSELPDYVVYDRHSFEAEEVEFRASGFFDKYWNVTTK